jgi:hypothetical protein
MRLAFVLTSDRVTLDAEAIARAYGALAPQGPALAPVPGEGKPDSELLAFEDGDQVIAALIAMPVPNREADEAARFSLSSIGTGWKLPPHGAQVMVVLEEQREQPATDALLKLARAAAAVADTVKAVGIYWGDASATHNPTFFRDSVVNAGAKLPVGLWLGLSVAHQGERLSLLSLGMKQFQLPDLLLACPRGEGKEMLSFFFELLDYVIRRGQAPGEGELVGRTADEKLPVRYVTSPIDADTDVWCVETA